MATDKSAAAKRTRALVSALREVGENKMADIVESSLTAGGTPKTSVSPDTAQVLALLP